MMGHGAASWAASWAMETLQWSSVPISFHPSVQSFWTRLFDPDLATTHAGPGAELPGLTGQELEGGGQVLF